MKKEGGLKEKFHELLDRVILFLEKKGVIDWQMTEQIERTTFNIRHVKIDMEKAYRKDMEWVAAMASLLGYKNGEVLNRFHPGSRKDTTDYILSHWWGITTKEDLLEQINRLYQNGHRANYDFLREIYTEHGLEGAIEYVKKEIEEPEHIKSAIVDLKRMDDAKSLFIKEGLMKAEDEIPAFVGWDYARIVSLMKWAVCSELIVESEIPKMLEAIDIVTPIREAYGSWREYGNAYLFARYIWNGDRDDFLEWKEYLHILLSNRNSPWVSLDWNLEIPSNKKAAN